jgi:sigma-B regulation protein RsbU (phosphoserine phosphatase)
VRFGAALRPCEHLAGDFYNVFRLDRDHLGLYLGDVMGHGAPAALLSVYAMQNLTTKRIEGNNYEIVAPSQALSQLNDDLLEAGFPGDPFVTMIYGVLEVPTLRLTFCNAGHPPAYLLRCSTGTQVLEPTRLPLGIGLSDYCDEEITLEPGDRLVLWSDGVDTLCWPGVGARGAALASFLAQDNDATPQQQIDRALACAQSLPGVSDDVALLMLRVG